MPSPSRPLADLSHVFYFYPGQDQAALQDLSLTIEQGQWVAIMGDNGSGKSTLSRILSGLSHPDSGQVRLLESTVFADGQVDFDSYDRVRSRISIVFQNPQDQIVSSLVEDDIAFGPENLGCPRQEISRRVDSSLRAVDIADLAMADPLDLSGGQQQRVTIASALAMEPDMLILDEPTAMLDAQGRQELMDRLRLLHEGGLTIVLITHNRYEALQTDRIVTMVRGTVVSDRKIEPSRGSRRRVAEDSGQGKAIGPGQAIGADQAIGSDQVIDPQALREKGIPVTILGGDQAKTSQISGDPVLTAQGLSYRYRSADHDTLEALSLSIQAGEFIALCGENGAGKSTLAMLLCALDKPSAGQVRIHGLDPFARKNRKEIRRHIGYVMQHPENQLFADTVAEDIAYGPRCLGATADQARRRALETARLLSIDHLLDRTPWDLSGGERRMVAIAGVLANQPDILLLDEPTAGLDAATSQRLLSLLDRLNGEGLTIIMISHDLADVAVHASRVLFLQATGKDDKDEEGSGRPAAATDQASTRSARVVRSAASTSSLLSRCDPRALILSSLALMIAAFTISTWPMLVWGMVLILLASWAGRVKPASVWLQVRWFLILFVFMGLINMFFVHQGRLLWSWGDLSLTTGGLWSALLYPSRFGIMIVIGAILLMVIPPMRMTDAFASLIKPLRLLGVPTRDVAFVLSLGMRFVPIISDEFLSLRRAQTARGASFGSGGFGSQVKAMTSLVVPVLAAAIRHAHNLALALDARCYSSDRPRSLWHPLAYSAADLLLTIFIVSWLAGLVLLKLL